jgi:1-deoxyxylulose-5-phosphate synthase
MVIKRLGKSGLKVSSLCLGTMTFGSGADEGESFKIMDNFFDRGYFFFDTADIYNSGRTEEIVGKWIKERSRRDDIVLATKVYGRTGNRANDAGLSRKHIKKALEQSLSRLGTDYIDLYQIHRWDYGSSFEETLDTLSGLIDEGKVRYLGCSNLKAWQLSEYLHYAETSGNYPFVSIQPLYNALNRSIEAEVLDISQKYNLGVIPYNPLAGGMLTGKYRKGKEMPEKSRLKEMSFYQDRYYTEEALTIIEKFVAYAEKLKVTPAQLALAWVQADPRVTSPIIGARTVEQLSDTIKGAELNLSPEDRNEVPSVKPCSWVGKDPVYNREPE